MWLTFSCWSLLFVASTMAFLNAPATQQSTQQSAVKDSGGPSAQPMAAQTPKTHHRVAWKRNSKAVAPRRGKRPVYRPEYTQNSVEVINGASTKKVVFHSDKNVPANGTTMNAPAPLRVEVVNGSSTDTQYFYQGNGQAPAQQGAERKRPVVIGIQSADTRVAGGNKRPVVTDITAVEPGDAKSASGGGAKLATGVAPQPKRPAYQPDAH